MERKRNIQTLKKGQVIFKEGDNADCMYDIRWGSVGIYANYGTKEEKLLTKLSTEEFFGEMGLIECELRSATAVALEKDTRVEVIDGECFGSFMQESPTKVLMIMQHMSHRLRSLTKDYVEVCKTVTEAVETENSGKEKSEGLQKNMKKFNDLYKEAVKNNVEDKEGN